MRDQSLLHTFDAAGRITARARRMTNGAMSGDLAVSFAYDPAGNMTRTTYADGFAVDYLYDALNRVTAAKHGSRVSKSVGYDRLSRRTSVGYGNGAGARYGYTARGDLLCHDWNFSGAPELAYDFTYNAVGQLLTKAVSDPQMKWVPPSAQRDTYAATIGPRRRRIVVMSGCRARLMRRSWSSTTR